MAASMISCTVEEGTVPGSDSKPSVVIYQYATKRPNNPDNDVALRFATNNKTEETYYLIEKTEEKKAHLASMGEAGYMDYVVSNGTKIDGASGEANVDVVFTDLYGTYAITAVALGGGAKAASETQFTGLDWTDVTTGTYHFAAVANVNNALGLTSVPTTLQICTTDNTLYRFKDVFGAGYSMKLNLINYSGEDADGKYQFFRVPATETSFTYGQHGTISVRDIGYWQGNDAFVTDNGYESGMYANYDCFIYIQYFVAAGNLGYGYDYFIAD